MNHISFFSGIGGFDLAAEMVGWHNVAHCEINEFCRHILKYYWPKAISYGDIKKSDFTVSKEFKQWLDTPNPELLNFSKGLLDIMPLTLPKRDAETEIK